LVSGGATDDGTILEPATLATMFEAHYQPDPRLSGIGLGFFRGEAGGHRLVYHDGILPGFNSELLLAPDDGIAVFGLTNGSPGAFGWLEIELGALLRQALGVAEGLEAAEMPQHAEVWRELCGRYVYPPGPADLRERFGLGAGAEVLVRDGNLIVRVLTPLPALYRGLQLVPDDPTDPYVFHLDLRPYGMSIVRVVFAGVVDGRATRVHTDLGGQPWSFVRAADLVATPARLMIGGLAVAGVGAALARRRRACE
jgi:hypothetical protein